jgi:flavorubredoxin
MADVVIIYVSKTGNTARAADEVLAGVKESGASVELKRVEDATVDDLRSAKGIILGSPCINDNYSTRMREFVEEKLIQAKPSDKLGAVFGTYKWNGGNIPKLEKDLRWKGMRLVAEGVNVHKREEKELIAKLRELGKKVGEETLKQ